MHACMPADAQSSSDFAVEQTMAEWSIMDREWPPDESFDYDAFFGMDFYYQDKPSPSVPNLFELPAMQPLPPLSQAQPFLPPQTPSPGLAGIVPQQLEQQQLFFQQQAVNHQLIEQEVGQPLQIDQQIAQLQQMQHQVFQQHQIEQQIINQQQILQQRPLQQQIFQQQQILQQQQFEQQLAEQQQLEQQVAQQKQLGQQIVQQQQLEQQIVQQQQLEQQIVQQQQLEQQIIQQQHLDKQIVQQQQLEQQIVQQQCIEQQIVQRQHLDHQIGQQQRIELHQMKQQKQLDRQKRLDRQQRREHHQRLERQQRRQHQQLLEQQKMQLQQQSAAAAMPAPVYPPPDFPLVSRGDNPREIRNKAEKQRRDKLNHSISELAAILPPVVAATKKIDKTGVLRLTAHYLRAHQYVFGESIGQSSREISPATAQTLLNLLDGFLLTTTYRGLVVVVSQNVQQYLGYAELDLLGQNVFNIVHPDDHHSLRSNLMPQSHLLGPHGELLFPDEPDSNEKVAAELGSVKRRFVIRFKKHRPRSEPAQYLSCFVEGTLRKSDRACRGYNKCCQMVRRARARGENPCASGNDVVFIGIVRPTTETFITERNIEAFRMEYRTRHSIDGEIMECEQRISLVTGYMTHEVNGVNAMNFMHRDDVRWVIFALREMYHQLCLVGESCYRLMTKNGQFIYLRTVGRLDVDEDSRAVRTFVCMNSVVDEEEGKQLIKIMKQKYKIQISNNESTKPIEFDETQSIDVSEEAIDNTVEDPRNLEKVILDLITELPADSEGVSDREDTNLPLAIIPPRKERVLSSIEKIYTVIKALNKTDEMATGQGSGSGRRTTSGMTCLGVEQPNAVRPAAPPSPSRLLGNPCALLRRQMEGREPLVLPHTSHTLTTPQSITNSPLHKPHFTTLLTQYDAEANYSSTLQEFIPEPTIMEVESEYAEAGDVEIMIPTTTAATAQPGSRPTNSSPSSSTVSTSPSSSAGTKRPNCNDDMSSQSKRLITQQQTMDLDTKNVSGGLELNESILTDDILTSVISNIENGEEPSFPELLDTDLEEILGHYEDDAETGSCLRTRIMPKLFKEETLL